MPGLPLASAPAGRTPLFPGRRWWWTLVSLRAAQSSATQAACSLTASPVPSPARRVGIPHLKHFPGLPGPWAQVLISCSLCGTSRVTSRGWCCFCLSVRSWAPAAVGTFQALCGAGAGEGALGRRSASGSSCPLPAPTSLSRNRPLTAGCFCPHFSPSPSPLDSAAGRGPGPTSPPPRFCSALRGVSSSST